MSDHVELDPVLRITVGSVGEPGSRIFVLQAFDESARYSWILEKEHVMALGNGAYALLAQIGQQEMTREILGKGVVGETEEEFEESMTLEADEPAYRVDPGSMALGYDEEREMIMISFGEMTAEDEEDPATAKLWLTRKQLAVIGVQAMTIVAQGRPVCPLCGEVLEDDHTCPPKVFNGHHPRRNL